MADIYPTPIGKVNLDLGSSQGEHAWMVKNMFLTPGGYEMMPEETASFTFGDGTTPRGAHYWSGGETARSYVALNTSLWEIHSSTATDVTGSSLTNSTNGVTFASYGEFCFASNGVDPIQAILVPSATGGTTNFGDMQYTSGGAQIAPKYICSHKNHLIGANAKMVASFNQLGTFTTGAGAAFTNQPAGDAVELLSSAVGDTTQSATIYGTRTGTGDTVHFEVKALNGVNVVTTDITDWNVILAVKIGVCAGDVTFREASGNATIVQILAGGTSAGVENVGAAIPAGNQTITIVADGATTRQIGLSADYWNGGVVYDSQALNGPTAVQSNERLINVLEVFTGNLENTRTVTITTFEFAVGSEHPYTVWISATDDPEGFGKPNINPTFVGVELLVLLDGSGEVTGAIDGGDCFFVFKEGSIYRIDGPPFVPTVIEYTIGMPPGSRPYRQGRYIYFWSNSGLQRIDINTNEVENLFEGRMLRSVSDFANANFGLTTGAWSRYPAPDAVEMENVVPTGNDVSISGDSRYGFVLMSFSNGSLGYGSLMYQSKEDCFVVPGTESPFGGVLWEIPGQQSSAPYPMGSIRMLKDTGASNTVFNWAITPLYGRAEEFRPYILLPFSRFDPNGAVGRITKIRPLFNEGTFSGGPVHYDLTFVKILSRSGVGRSWTDATSTLTDSYSNDGWFHTGKCPHADYHSVSFSPYHSQATTGGIINMVGVDVAFELAPKRSR